MKKTFDLLIASGVNLDLLGSREPLIYGQKTLDDMRQCLQMTIKEQKQLHPSIKSELCFFQTNIEHELLAKFTERRWDGIVLNAGAWTHTSVAIADRLAAIQIPFVEVHCSQLAMREDFRQRSYTAKYAIGIVHGFGIHSYRFGLLGLIEHLTRKESSRKD